MAGCSQTDSSDGLLAELTYQMPDPFQLISGPIKMIVFVTKLSYNIKYSSLI